MLTNNQKTELDAITNKSLDVAEQTWSQVGGELVEKQAMAALNAMAKSVETEIPGYPVIEHGTPKVSDFIAIVVDMRGSTDHLVKAISPKKADVSQLQRVFYETAALLPALAKAISYRNGAVTEYLGDGVLGLFLCEKEDGNGIYDAYNGALKCLDTVDEVTNPILNDRYRLPPLKIGVGLSHSSAVVTLVGLTEEYMQPKVFGECVWRATKLAQGTNQIYICKALRLMWPTSKDGKLTFKKKSFNKLDGYLVSKNE